MTPSFSSSTSTLKKYFPHLHIPNDDGPRLPTETAGIFFSTISISAFSSAIIRSNQAKKTGEFFGFDIFPAADLLTNFHTALLNDRHPNRPLQFANIAQLASFPLWFAAGVTEEKEEEEENYGKGMAPKAENPRGKISWSEMPKFLLAGAVSTIISRTCVAPLERLKLECIVQGTKKTWIRTVQWIWASEGLLGFWKGNLLNLFRMVPFKSINFICFDMYCDQLLQTPGKSELTNHDRLIGGGISGVVATVICLPLDTIRTRLLAPGGEALGGVMGCFLHMVHKEGFLSLYKGLTPALLSMGPASAVFYAVYDILKASYLGRFDKNKGNNSNNNSNNGGESKGDEGELGAVRTLIYGAIAGACAETITYPLEVIRRQFQLNRAASLGLAAGFSRMIERDGITSLFAGLVPSTLQVLPSAALSYLFYEMMKTILKIN